MRTDELGNVYDKRGNPLGPTISIEVVTKKTGFAYVKSMLSAFFRRRANGGEASSAEPVTSFEATYQSSDGRVRDQVRIQTDHTPDL